MGLSIIFALLACCGVWRPVSWSSQFKTVIYNVYSLFVLWLAVSFTISQFITAVTVDNVDDFVENTYILVTAFVGCCKMTNMLICREGVIDLIESLLVEPCATVDDEETKIQTECDKQVRNNTIKYMMMIQTSVATTMVTSLLTDFRNERLTYKAWIPYNYSSTVLFQFTYAQQLLSLFFLSYAHIVSDALFFGLLTQTSCQFNILEYRLNNVQTNGKRTLESCIRHHNSIYKLAAMTNNALNITIFSQFFGSFLVLCLGLAQLLKQDLVSFEFLSTMCYLSTIMVQSFLYCWYGNEVKLKSIELANSIFQTDWIGLNEDAKKILLIAMSRTRSPIEYESAHVVNVNIDFFVILVKSSYSMFNLLQNTKQ